MKLSKWLLLILCVVLGSNCLSAHEQSVVNQDVRGRKHYPFSNYVTLPLVTGLFCIGAIMDPLTIPYCFIFATGAYGASMYVDEGLQFAWHHKNFLAKGLCAAALAYNAYKFYKIYVANKAIKEFFKTKDIDFESLYKKLQSLHCTEDDYKILWDLALRYNRLDILKCIMVQLTIHDVNGEYNPFYKNIPYFIDALAKTPFFNEIVLYLLKKMPVAVDVIMKSLVKSGRGALQYGYNCNLILQLRAVGQCNKNRIVDFRSRDKHTLSKEEQETWVLCNEVLDFYHSQYSQSSFWGEETYKTKSKEAIDYLKQQRPETYKTDAIYFALGSNHAGCALKYLINNNVCSADEIMQIIIRNKFSLDKEIMKYLKYESIPKNMWSFKDYSDFNIAYKY